MQKNSILFLSCLISLACAQSTIMYSEIMNNGLGGSIYEFLELHNYGSADVNMKGFNFTKGIAYYFAPTTDFIVNPGEYVVIASNATAFEQRYKFQPSAEYQKGLSKKSDDIILVDSQGGIVFALNYSDNGQWPQCQSGYSWVPATVNTTASELSNPSNWRCSSELYGSPGLADPEPSLQHTDSATNVTPTSNTVHSNSEKLTTKLAGILVVILCISLYL